MYSQVACSSQIHVVHSFERWTERFPSDSRTDNLGPGLVRYRSPMITNLALITPGYGLHAQVYCIAGVMCRRMEVPRIPSTLE